MHKSYYLTQLGIHIKHNAFRGLNLWILFLILILIGCSDDNPSPDPVLPVITDISVTSTASSITWIDDNDLTQKLENALFFNYGNALESEIEETQTFASDSSQVTVTIGFKEAFQGAYIDPNASNNSVTIALEKEVGNGAAIQLNADGPGNTYDLITSVLAPGFDPIEVPDCSHPTFGDHIDELFDSELNTNVFRFYMHTDPDNDRCINFDRQRNEIKTYDKSPDNLLGIENETVVYKWKFKLPAGFQSSPNFTHIHQVKSVGGSLESMPMYTLTTRKSSPDRLELRYAETDTQVTLAQTELAPLIDVWMEVTETISYGVSGTYDITIKRVSDDSVLFEYSNNDIINWRPNADFVRPKWGIYRSLINEQDLRDEALLFANFSIEEL
jgi:hypothetical protein